MKVTPDTELQGSRTEHERVLAGLNLIQQAISIYDDDLRLVTANLKFAEMFDLPDALLRKGATFGDTIRTLAERGEYGDADIEETVATRVALARTFEPHYFERIRPNGKHISVEGHPLQQGGWVAVYTDISGFKQQEALLKARTETLNDKLMQRNVELERAIRELTSTNAELQENRRALAQSETRLRLVAEAAPGHLAYIDHNLIYQYSNHRLDSDLMRGADPVGRRVKDVLHPGVYDRMSPSLTLVLKGQPMSEEYEVTCEKGGQRAFRTILTPHQSDTGSVLGLYALTLDVTDQMRANEHLIQSRRMEAAATATSALAHDFANLLTIIMGLQGRLSRLGDMSDEAKELIAGIDIAAKRGGALVEQLSTASGERNFAPQPTDLAHAVHQIAEIARPSALEDIRFSIEAPETLGWLMIDAGYMHDAILNLLFNARDAVNGQDDARIALTVTADTGRIVIEVCDNGPGFPPETKRRAFDPFFTTKGDGGLGLGLSTVFNFAKASDGDVEISTSDWGGACVAIDIPKIKATKPHPDTAPAKIGADGIALVVDDETEVRAAARETLRSLGWPVLEASSAEEAESLAQNIADISVVLSDITMAGTDGPTLLHRLKAAHPQLTTLLMTGLPAGIPLRTAASADFTVVQKPFDAETLAIAIAEAAP